MTKTPTVERWVDLRVELLVDGVVVADSPQLGILATTPRDGVIADPVGTIDRTLIDPAHCPDRASNAIAVIVGKRHIPRAGMHLPNETVIFYAHAFDECWIDGRLIPSPSPSPDA